MNCAIYWRNLDMRSLYYRFLPYFLSFFCLIATDLSMAEAKEGHKRTVNILSRDLFNEAGKEVDAKILKEELEKMGYAVRLCDFLKEEAVKEADVNLFLAQFKKELFSKAKQNWLLVNPDFCVAPPEDLLLFDLILCKTQESERIFKSISKKVYFLGFTSLDFYKPSIAKDYSLFLHVAGKSRMKGTDEVIDVWRSHPELPPLILIKRDGFLRSNAKNIEFIAQRVSRKALTRMQNECAFHVCPSKTEGFGHYLMEGMAVGAIVITVDAPPMNEFIQDERCLVRYHSVGQQNYATTYTVDPKDLLKKIKSLQKLPLEELQAIGRANAERYYLKKEEFKENLRLLIAQELGS